MIEMILDRPRPQPEAMCAGAACEATRLLVTSDRMRLAGDLDLCFQYAQNASVAGPCPRSGAGCTGYARIWFAMLLIQIRRTERAGQVLDAVDGSAPGPALSVAATIARANIAMVEGAIDNAVVLATAGLGAAADIGLRAWTPMAHLVLATAALYRADVVSASRYLHDLERDTVFGRPGCSIGQAAWVALRVEQARRGNAAVAPLAAELLANGPLVTELLIAQPAAAPWLVRFGLARRDRELAAQTVRVVDRLAADNAYFPSLAAAAGHAHGLLDADPGLLGQAADRHLDRYAQAAAWEDLGVLQAAGAREADAATATLARAKLCYTAIGAAEDSARVRDRLRALGAAHRGPTP